MKKTRKNMTTVRVIYTIYITNTGLPRVRETSGKFNFFSRSGNCQGILQNVREFGIFGKCQGIVR